MNDSTGLTLIPPSVAPALDRAFRPASLATRAFRELARASKAAVLIELALEQADGSVFRFQTEALPEGHPQAGANFIQLERMVKFLLWSRGGFRIYFNGPKFLGAALEKHFRETPTGKFDSEIVGGRIFDRAIEVVMTRDLPAERLNTTPLGRHLEGCRIGFDLGGSDRKVAAVIEGNVVFSEETVWDPYFQKDPQYHFDGIMDSLRKAAAHLPRVDAIGGSAAGVYVNNRVKVASLFRGIPLEVFNSKVKDMFLNIRKEWENIPFEIVNDGEVTALAGSMALKQNGVLGISLGTSTAGGYVNREGNITSWLNEMAFMPVDYNPGAPVDEWSGDYGCGVQYFSQQCVGRLLPVAGIKVDASLPLPEKLKHVQSLMAAGDERARKIYQTIGVYLGYALAHYADFYDFGHMLILGRVTSGAGGEVIIDCAKKVLAEEFAKSVKPIVFHVPDEQEKRHGQAVAAASLPKLKN